MPTRPGERPTCGTIIAPGRLTGGWRHDVADCQRLSLDTRGEWSSIGPRSTGSFDYDLEFAPTPDCADVVLAADSRPDQPPEGTTADSSRMVSSIFTAVQEQLGLRLDVATRPRRSHRRRVRRSTERELIMTIDSSITASVLKRIVVAATAIAATIGPAVLLAQIVAPAADAPVFEAASIRPAADTGRRGGRGTPGRFTGFNLPARQLIRQAYDIHDAQIVGGPDWLATQGFDINATSGDQQPVQMRFMMQTLLRDRFKLTFHTEKRELPIYALVVARSDGRLGSGLRRIPDGECPPPGARRGAPPAGPPPTPPSPSDPNPQMGCGQMMFGPGRLVAHGVEIDMLARSIGGLPAITSFNRVVRNLTGLEGQYDFDFKWTNEFGPGRGGPGGPPPAGPPPTPGPDDEPTLVTALQEQLGLKLDPRRATVDVLVIDSIEKPTEN